MDINARLERLERENRRMKKIGIVSAVVVSMFIVGGQAKTNRVVEANEFRLLDSSGKVRVHLSAIPSGALAFYDSDGKIVAALSTTPSPTLILESTGAGQDVSLSAGTATLSAFLKLGSGSSTFVVNAGKSIRLFGSAGIFSVNTDEDVGGPSVTVTDKEGYANVLGRADLESPGTGRKTRTPAASLALFGKDKKVLCAVN